MGKMTVTIKDGEEVKTKLENALFEKVIAKFIECIAVNSDIVCINYQDYRKDIKKLIVISD